MLARGGCRRGCKMSPDGAMTAYALYRRYPNGLRARITPTGISSLLELFDDHGRRTPDLPVIASSIEEAQQLADDHAGVDATDPWMPVYPGTFKVVLPEELSR
jgi:hypothetical protein